MMPSPSPLPSVCEDEMQPWRRKETEKRRIKQRKGIWGEDEVLIKALLRFLSRLI